MPAELKSNLKVPSCCQNTPEIIQPKKVQFTGKVPSWLQGTILANGPGVFDLEKGSVKHWLDGFAVTTKLVIDGSNACLTIASKLVHTTALRRAMKARKPILNGFGTPPGVDDNKGFFSKLLPFTTNDITDNCIGRVTAIGPSIFAFADSPIVYELQASNLSTGPPISVYKTFNLNSVSPEILTDSRTGDLYICGTKITPTFHYVFLKLPKNYAINNSSPKKSLENPKFSVVGSLPSRWKFGPCGLRSCFTLTENYIIFIEVPCIINLMRVAATWIKGYSMLDWIDWIPQEKTRFYIMRKDTGKVSKVEYLSKHGFLIPDIINAYEDGDKIILDICTQSNTSLFDSMMISNLRSFTSPKDYHPSIIERFVIPLITDVKKYSEGTQLLSPDCKATATKGHDSKIILTSEKLNDQEYGFDTGVINNRFASRKHDYIYSVANVPSVVSSSSNSTGIPIIKLDTNCKRTKEWRSNPGFFPWKVIFVPNPTGQREDEGVLISHVTNLTKRQSYLVIIDAETMEELARADFKDIPIPPWFHATWF